MLVCKTISSYSDIRGSFCSFISAWKAGDSLSLSQNQTHEPIELTSAQHGGRWWNRKEHDSGSITWRWFRCETNCCPLLLTEAAPPICPIGVSNSTGERRRCQTQKHSSLQEPQDGSSYIWSAVWDPSYKFFTIKVLLGNETGADQKIRRLHTET